MNKSPLLSVITPAYNCEQYIESSIKSILNQTFSDFELIIINDCSTDKTEEKILNIKDKRIIYKKNVANLGESKARNIALSFAKGKYIANQDGDDISVKDRLSKQIRFLESNPDYGLVGSRYTIIDSTDKKMRDLTTLVTDPQLINGMVTQNRFAHGSIMYRKECLNDATYDESLVCAQDYLFIHNIMKKFKVANLDETLFYYRVHENCISNRSKDKMISATKLVRSIIWNDYLIGLGKHKLIEGNLYSYPKYIRIDYAEALKDIGLIIQNTNKTLASKYFLASYLYDPTNTKRLGRYIRSLFHGK
jgi:glycosyltransferase involved in cell wall biosynthesis